MGNVNMTELMQNMNKTGEVTLPPSGSYNVSDARKAEVLFQFIAEGIILNLVGMFGMFGNCVSMVILSRPQMRCSINYLLIGLARCDTVLILTSILLFGLPAINAYTGYLYHYQYEVGSASVACSGKSIRGKLWHKRQFKFVERNGLKSTSFDDLEKTMIITQNCLTKS